VASANEAMGTRVAEVAICPSPRLMLAGHVRRRPPSSYTGSPTSTRHSRRSAPAGCAWKAECSCRCARARPSKPWRPAAWLDQLTRSRSTSTSSAAQTLIGNEPAFETTAFSVRRAFRPQRRFCGLNSRELPANLGNRDWAEPGPGSLKAPQMSTIRANWSPESHPGGRRFESG
jgi:hypothetical protein